MPRTEGRIRGLFAAYAAEAGGFAGRAVRALELDPGGIPGDRHHGLFRAAGPREPWMARGLPIRNDRQMTAVSAAEMAELARRLELPHVDAALIGANLLIEGMPDFSRIAPGSQLAIGGAGKAPFRDGAILRVEAYNRPCRKSGRALAMAHGRPELEFAFVRQAAALRGLALSVTYPAGIAEGDAVKMVPPLIAP